MGRRTLAVHVDQLLKGAQVGRAVVPQLQPHRCGGQEVWSGRAALAAPLDAGILGRRRRWRAAHAEVLDAGGRVEQLDRVAQLLLRGILQVPAVGGEHGTVHRDGQRTSQ